jgi:hypothetical protein
MKLSSKRISSAELVKGFINVVQKKKKKSFIVQGLSSRIPVYYSSSQHSSTAAYKIVPRLTMIIDLTSRSYPKTVLDEII